MLLIFAVGRFFLNIIYAFHKAFPVKDRIAIVSRQSDRPSEDVRLLCDELKRLAPEKEVVVSCKMIGGGIGGKIKYVFYMAGTQMHLFASSRAVILDGYCIAASLLRHRPELKIVQMWHAMGAMKKFGYLTVGEEEGCSETVAKGMRMHKNYSVVFVSSSVCKRLLAPAYGCGEEIMRVMPLPRADLLTDGNFQRETRKRILRRYPQLSTKENILYAPTFRKNQTDVEYVLKLVSAVDFSKYNLIIKLHPLVHCDVGIEPAVSDRLFSSIEMLSAADYVITDYSAFMFEAALAGKPLFRFIPDNDAYARRRGFLIDIDAEFPGEQSADAEVILGKITQKAYDLEKVRAFAAKYIEKDGSCTKNMAEYILGLE